MLYLITLDKSFFDTKMLCKTSNTYHGYRANDANLLILARSMSRTMVSMVGNLRIMVVPDEEKEASIIKERLHAKKEPTL